MLARSLSGRQHPKTELGLAHRSWRGSPWRDERGDFVYFARQPIPHVRQLNYRILTYQSGPLWISSKYSNAFFIAPKVCLCDVPKPSLLTTMATLAPSSNTRPRPYRRFLTSAFHSRFVQASSLALLVAFDTTFWISDKRSASGPKMIEHTDRN